MVVFNTKLDVLLGYVSYKNTACKVEIVQMLEIYKFYEKKSDVAIFAIVTQDIQSSK